MYKNFDKLYSTNTIYYIDFLDFFDFFDFLDFLDFLDFFDFLDFLDFLDFPPSMSFMFLEESTSLGT